MKRKNAQPSFDTKLSAILRIGREFLTLVIAAGAGGVFLYLCIQPVSNSCSKILSLALCLTLLRKMTLLDRVLKAWNDR